MLWLIEQFQSNQFLVGTTVPFLLAAAAYLGRRFLFAIWRYILLTFSCTIRYNNNQAYYDNVANYVYNNIVANKFTSNTNASSLWEDGIPTLTLSMSFGNSWGWYKGWPVRITRTEEAIQNSIEVKEHLELTVYCLTPKMMLKSITKLLDSIIKETRKNNVIEISLNGYSHYKKPIRSIDTMNIKESTKKLVLEHLDKFISSEDEYIRNGIPYHTGILFHGKPGTGKSSMTHVIASYLKRDIYLHTKGNILECGIVPKRSILSLEDVDAAQIAAKTSDRRATETNNMSEVLNFLDSFITPHGLITVATTNNIEALDPAFTRKGRFDLIINMDEA